MIHEEHAPFKAMFMAMEMEPSRDIPRDSSGVDDIGNSLKEQLRPPSQSGTMAALSRVAGNPTNMTLAHHTGCQAAVSRLIWLLYMVNIWYISMHISSYITVFRLLAL